MTRAVLPYPSPLWWVAQAGVDWGTMRRCAILAFVGLSYGNHLRKAAGRPKQKAGDVFPVRLLLWRLTPAGTADSTNEYINLREVPTAIWATPVCALSDRPSRWPCGLGLSLAECQVPGISFFPWYSRGCLLPV